MHFLEVFHSAILSLIFDPRVGMAFLLAKVSCNLITPVTLVALDIGLYRIHSSDSMSFGIGGLRI